jgi:hypothetical protein
VSTGFLRSQHHHSQERKGRSAPKWPASPSGFQFTRAVRLMCLQCAVLIVIQCDSLGKPCAPVAPQRLVFSRFVTMSHDESARSGIIIIRVSGVRVPPQLPPVRELMRLRRKHWSDTTGTVGATTSQICGVRIVCELSRTEPNSAKLAETKWGCAQSLASSRSHACSPSLALRHSQQGVAGANPVVTTCHRRKDPKRRHTQGTPRSRSLSDNRLEAHSGFPIHGASTGVRRDLLILGQLCWRECTRQLPGSPSMHRNLAGYCFRNGIPSFRIL